MTHRSKLSSICLLLFVLIAAPSFAGDKSLTGSWKTVNTPDGPGPQADSLFTFHRDGGLIGTPSSNGLSAAHGSWEKTGARSFAATAVFYILDSNGNLALEATVNSEYELSTDGQSFNSTYETTLRTPGGQGVGTVTGSVSGVRINVQGA